MKTIMILSNHHLYTYKLRKELIQKLIELGHRVILTLPYGEKVELLKDMGCEFIEIPLDRRSTNPVTDFKLFLTYKKLIRELKPDIVLTYTIKPNIYGGIACRMTKTTYLPNITGLGTAIENDGLIQKVTLKLYKTALKRAKCVFFQNEQNKQLFIDKGILVNDSKVLPGSGVNMEEHSFEEYPKDKGIIRFLFIGRIMKAKGVDELLEAAEQINKSEKNVEFHLVGFSEESYSEQLKILSESGIIHFHGQQDDVHKFIRESHATILPSYHEGMSNVLLESASMGRPILASNVAGCTETFDEGLSGIGFEVKSAKSLVDAILKFLNLPYEKKKQMGIAGRKKIELEFDRKIIINNYLTKINELREK